MQKQSFCASSIKLKAPMGLRLLNLLSFNVRSPVETSRRIDLNNTLFHNNIDIGFIQECHLKTNRKVVLRGYAFLYDNSPIGVAIVIKEKISYSRYSIGGIKLFCTFITIESNSNGSRKNFLFGSVYIPCNFPTLEIYDGLNKILDAANSFDGIILGGDLNAKNQESGDTIENSNGKVLHSWLQDHAVDVLRLCDNCPSFPNGSSFLDHFLVSAYLINDSLPSFKTSSLPTFSDHFPIKLELQLDLSELVKRSPCFSNSYKKTNWNLFRRDMEISSLSIMPAEDKNLQNVEIDDLINEFNSNFNSIHNVHSERIEFKNNKIPLSEQVKKYFSIKHRWQRELTKIYHRTGNRLSYEYNILSKQIQLLKSIIKELVNLDQAKKFNERLKNIRPGPTAFKEIYNVIGIKKSPFCQQIVINDTVITDDNENANHFPNYYPSVYSEELPERALTDLDQRVSSCLNVVSDHIYSFDRSFNALESNDSYHFTNFQTVKGIVKVINNKKSYGIDGFSNFVIRKFPDTTLNLLKIVFNNCLNNGYFPTVWKSA